MAEDTTPLTRLILRKSFRTGLNTLQFFISNKEIVGSFQGLPPQKRDCGRTLLRNLYGVAGKEPSNPLMLQNHPIYYYLSYRREQHAVHG